VKKLYVGNFSFQMTEPELRALFEPYGTIESASLATDRDSGRSRGFGFVSMTNDDEAEKAMAALNGKESGGRALTVNEARPQTQRTGGFREGGRGDRGPRQRRDRWWKPALQDGCGKSCKPLSMMTWPPLSAINADNGLPSTTAAAFTMAAFTMRASLRSKPPGCKIYLSGTIFRNGNIMEAWTYRTWVDIMPRIGKV
jgi:cold-inducible RNA-binding protein